MSSTNLIIDCHCDSLIYRYVRGDAVDLCADAPIYSVDLTRLCAGNVSGLFCMVGDNSMSACLSMIDSAWKMCAEHSDVFSLCLSSADMRQAATDGKIGIVLTIEGQKMMDEQLSGIRNLHRLGVRFMSLTHGEGQRPALQFDRSHFGYLSASDRSRLQRHSKGLTPFAFEALTEMEVLHIPVDLAHLNDAAFWQVIEYSKGPLMFSHGGCYSLCPHTRCLTDEMMQALAEAGGVLGIAFHPVFIDQNAPSLDRLCDHFIHAMEVMGEDRVCIGSDFDGVPPPTELIPPDPSCIGILLERLQERGVSEASIRGIAGENVLRFWERAEQGSIR